MSARNSKSKSAPNLASVGASKEKQKKASPGPHLKRLKDSSKPKKLGKKKSMEGFKPVAKIPSSRADSSSNWKALLQKQGKQVPSVPATSASSNKKTMDCSKDTDTKRGRNSLGSDTESTSTGRSRSVSGARCGSQLSMASESASSIRTDNYDGSDASLHLDSDQSQKVKQEFRALGLSQTNASQQKRQSRYSEKTQRFQMPRYSSEKKLKSCLPQGLNEFGFFDYSHYGALRTQITPAHAEFMVDTGIVSMDCEMVGVGPMKESALARVSIVNRHGFCLYDRFVKPKMEVTDYRTEFSGVREADLKNAPPLQVVVKEVSDFLRSHILIGHSLKSDLAVLFLNHQKARMRDTAYFFKRMLHTKTPKLKTLVKKLLGIDIQQGEHSSIIDAQAAMALYLLYQKEWEVPVRQSNRGIDVYKECLDEFKQGQQYKYQTTTPPPPQLPPQPSTSLAQENWYILSAENDFCDNFQHFSVANGACAMPMSMPVYLPVEQIPQEVPQMNFPSHTNPMNYPLQVSSLNYPIQVNSLNYPSRASPVNYPSQADQMSFVSAPVPHHENCPPFYGSVNVPFYQQPLPVPVQSIGMSLYPYGGYPVVGMAPPQHPQMQFIPNSPPTPAAPRPQWPVYLKPADLMVPVYHPVPYPRLDYAHM